ncbi:unnamed protein product [Caenorhabditis auriculariae]|uniref:Golgin-84 n=1 Tax=Caenorhabditis auriculariae TaxID=2777116 RepID=A0A8S1H3M4_9PELO|nr:unnamed protein product [Caenorhabditis auriculariae]
MNNQSTSWTCMAAEITFELTTIAGDAIHTVRDKPSTSRIRKSSTASVPPTAVPLPEYDRPIVTEDVGRGALSIPSRAYSDYTGGQPVRKPRPPVESSTTNESSRDNWTLVLNEGGKDPEISTRDEDSRSRRSSGGRSIASVRTTNGSEMHTADVSQLKSQLWAKDSQISLMKAKIADVEKKLEKRSQDYYEMKAEKDMIEQRLANQKQFVENADSLEEMKLARKKAQHQKDMVVEECNQMKRKVVGLEEEIRAMVEQLRLAKFNLNENKKEFDEYKTKAQKILTAKEKLVESLKAEQGIGSVDRPGHLLQAEVEEIKVERDLARSDLESAQLQVYTLRSDMEELEAQIRDLQSQLGEHKRGYLEERHSWETTVTLLNEKVECARIESEFAKQEMKRQNDANHQKIQEKEAELRRAVEEGRARKREEVYRNYDNDKSIGEMLLQKQQELEEALRTNQVLNVRLDRLQKSSRETVISMETTSSLSSNSATSPLLQNVANPHARHAISAIDSTAFRAISMLRNYPSARLFFVLYFLVLHLWVFFIILTYTPEIH